jgi:methylated-DNA-[protein]-cysteine S-methyltransferase
VEVIRYEAAGWGIGELGWERGRLLYHELPAPAWSAAPNLPQGIPEIPVVSVPAKDSRGCAGNAPALAQCLIAYFAGDDGAPFDDVRLDIAGYTPFQRALVQALRAVPRGETVTYAELAALAGRPNAQRAAGSFCARNRFGVLVPCHRVVAAGGLGSYGTLGLEYKRRLLRLEGAVVAV